VDEVNRVTFLVDGFNLYHSVREAAQATGESLKWLDLRSLCASYLSAIGGAAHVEQVFYFSAFAHFLTPRDPGVILRHKAYVNALTASGVVPVMGRFKWKPRWCPVCKVEHPGHEEKETDVAIAVMLLELCINDACDTAVLVSGDTDLLPAIRSARRLYPDKQVWVTFPHGRHNAELALAADNCITIKRKKYGQHQLPDPVLLADGREARKPEAW
jgi:uncharacterized LabA/DUF88 family protein